jgi:hypothetical protein
VWVQPGLKTPRHIAEFIRENRHFKVLMMAGNRECRDPGIGDRVEAFLMVVSRRLGLRPGPGVPG